MCAVRTVQCSLVMDHSREKKVNIFKVDSLYPSISLSQFDRFVSFYCLIMAPCKVAEIMSIQSVLLIITSSLLPGSEMASPSSVTLKQ